MATRVSDVVNGGLSAKGAESTEARQAREKRERGNPRGRDADSAPRSE